MPTSERRIEANRRNAQKSTGPKTEEGKAKSRRNGLKHGLRGEGIVLVDEDRLALEKTEGDWVAEFGAESPSEVAFARRAALAAVRLERCKRAESAALEERRRHARRSAIVRRKRAVEALAADLPKDPSRIAPVLESTAEGCRWLLKRWVLLRLALEGRGYWTRDELDRALDFLGLDEAEHRWDVAFCRINAAHLSLAPDAQTPPDASPADDHRFLLERVRRETSRLRRLLRARKIDRQLDLSAADECAYFDGSKRATLMRRYESAAMSDLKSCHTLLTRGKDKEKKARDDRPSRPSAPKSEAPTSIEPLPPPDEPKPAPEPAPPAPDEPNAAPTTGRKSRRKRAPIVAAALLLLAFLGRTPVVSPGRATAAGPDGRGHRIPNRLVDSRFSERWVRLPSDQKRESGHDLGPTEVGPTAPRKAPLSGDSV